MKTIVKAALKVAKKYPVFPTNDKMPCWSNKDLGVGKGDGGYKIATQDPDKIEELFSHTRAIEIAVPMGAMSGLMCIDVDLYKMPELQQWVTDNWEHLKDTLTHTTRSGGLHFFFLHPGDTIRFPATLRPGVDIKAVGTGYVCWPGTKGYAVEYNKKPREFPMDLLKQAMLEKGGTGSVRLGSSFNDATDDDLIEQIQDASDLYPALRSLSYRLPSRRMDNGYRLTEPEMVTILENLMDTSVASDPAHERYDDWVDRRSKIAHLVETAVAKERGGVALTDDDIELMTQGESFIKTQEILAANIRPIGPQRETTAQDIRERVAAQRTADKSESANDSSDELIVVNAKQLHERTIEPIKWIVPGMIPEGGTVSLAGMSNVGKTRWLASLLAGLSVGDTERVGLPPSEGKTVSLWIANEEHADDICRRLKAVHLQHGDKDSADIAIRGKADGTLRLVALNEAGNPEIDEDNVAKIVRWIEDTGARLLIFDPYVTLSDALDENSATSASMLTKAFLLIIAETGVAIMHAHHTPKGGRAEDKDWVRGDASAWRGSGAIYSALDCGFTLANWMPSNKEKRKEWKQKFIEEKLGRFVVLDTGKIREGEPLEPVIYELVGQEMAKGEGRDIGVCHLTHQANAENAMLYSSADVIAASELGSAMIKKVGYGRHTSMAQVGRQMEGHPMMPDLSQSRGKPDLYALFEETVSCTGGYVTMIKGESKNKKVTWAIQIDEKGVENG
jgi:hypothetical protein